MNTTERPDSHHHDQHRSDAAAARVAVALQECTAAETAALNMAHRTDAEHAHRAARLALITARKTGWWRVLARNTYRDLSLNTVHGLAAVVAGENERNRARFWRDAAAEWTARAEQRPTSDAAGALSNWHELGVSA